MIPEALIQDIKVRVDAAAIFGRHVELRRSGAGFVAACPFHEDRSPSFRVYPDQARFHCFGCGVKGDVFTFLQRVGGKDFPTVVRELAAEVGVTVGSLAAGPADPERAAILEACAVAQRQFEDGLWSAVGEGARAYLAQRRIAEQTARDFRLGYARGDLGAAWKSPDPAVPGLRLAGLVDASGRDRFTDRLILPLSTGDGRVVGFVARVVRGGAGPRYLTTPENAAFQHSRVLFGLAQASAAIRRLGSALFVPTYFDVLACHGIGLQHAVGGCHLSRRHVELLRRQGARIVTVFRPPHAQEITPELAAAVFAAGPIVQIASLPAPGDQLASCEALLRAGGRTALEALASAATPLSEHLIDTALRVQAGTGRPVDLESKVAAVSWLARYVAAIPPGLARNVFERRVAQRLRLTLRAIRGAAKAADPSAAGARLDYRPRRRRMRLARRQRRS